MTAFQEFRRWAREGPAGERITAVVATAAVLSALVWMLVRQMLPCAAAMALFVPEEEQDSLAAALGELPHLLHFVVLSSEVTFSA